MTQHFLLSAKARTLSLKDIYQGGEDKAYETFKALRWTETEGRAVCPRCGGVDAYEIKSRRKFKCSACAHQFSVTSGTIFASRKLGFCDLLAAICFLANASKGMSSLQLSRDLDVQYKTAWVLAHKLRQALAAETADTILDGEVEVDGAYFGGTVRPENRKEDRVDRRTKEHQSDDRRSVVALRQRGGRTLTKVGREESEGVEFTKGRITAKSVLFADEARHWDNLEMLYDVNRINHSKLYSEGHGKHTNMVESYFARLRRMVAGQHHHVSHKYLYQYANHAAWMEDHRQNSNGANASKILGECLSHPVSRDWKGYWQRAAK